MPPLPGYAQALELAVQAAVPLARVEHIALHNAGSAVLADAVCADRDLPPFNRAQMDGYAIRAAEFVPNKSWPVAGVIAAGTSPQLHVPPGACIAIATGAALPSDVDTVIPHEWSDRGDHQGKPVQFTVESISRGHAVHQRASDARRGDQLIAPGTTLAAHHLGIAAAIGLDTMTVRAKPRVMILTSGDEIVPVSTPTHDMPAHQIRNSNAAMLHNLMTRLGCTVINTVHLPDERDQTIAAIGTALQHADLVLTVGGVSAGERDFFPDALDAHHIARTLRGASIQPGRPIVVGRAPNDAVVIALPGNPVSALACACLFAWPVVRVMLGLEADLPWRMVRLAQPVKPNASRRAFRPACLEPNGDVIVPTWAGSGDLAHTAPTAGLLELPVQADAAPAGTMLRFLPWP